jgi:predicted alpha/beta hydrolase
MTQRVRAAYRLRGTTVTVEVEGIAVARVIGMGSNDPTLQTRDWRGRWRTRASIDDAQAHVHLGEYAELASWLLRQRAR